MVEKPRVIQTVGILHTHEETVLVDEYALAVGKVTASWNTFQEELGRIFAEVIGVPRRVALAVWYSTRSDRSQRAMLKAAVAASEGGGWNARFPKAREDLLWLLGEANKLAEDRNDAIHAPIAIETDVPAATSEVVASMSAYHYGQPQARRLLGKNLITEFEWCERRAAALTLFTAAIYEAFVDEQRLWPKRPRLPTRGQKRAAQDPPHPPRKRSRARRHRSSRA
jgi:hypothetical protein